MSELYFPVKNIHTSLVFEEMRFMDAKIEITSVMFAYIIVLEY